jgi:hypothetical protein
MWQNERFCCLEQMSELGKGNKQRRQFNKLQAELHKQQSEWDGFAAMSPFLHTGCDSSWVTAAMLYSQTKNNAKSAFFNRRERVHAQRHWTSSTVQELLIPWTNCFPNPLDTTMTQCMLRDSQQEQRIKINISRVALTCDTVDEQWGRHPAEFDSVLDFGVRVLRAYFEVQAGSCNFEVGQAHRTLDIPKKGNVRNQPGSVVPLLQVNAKALEVLLEEGGLADACGEGGVEDARRDGGASKDGRTWDANVFFVAPHLYDSSQKWASWLFSSHIGDSEGRLSGAPNWVLSSFQTFAVVSTAAGRERVSACNLLYAALSASTPLSVCENRPCIMNNTDSVEESADHGTLLLCPSCLRCLQV